MKCVVCVATALPATSFTPEIVSVIVDDAGRGACGVINTFWFEFEKLIDAGTDVIPPPETMIVAPVTVTGSIGPLNTTATFAFTGTLPRLFAGLTVNTVGATVCVTAPVVKFMAVRLWTQVDHCFPADRSGSTLTYTQYCLFAAN